MTLYRVAVAVTVDGAAAAEAAATHLVGNLRDAIADLPADGNLSINIYPDEEEMTGAADAPQT